MPRTSFTTKHFIACLAVSWEGSPGAKTRRTLEGVGYTLEMPPGAEPPFTLDELWVFARFYRVGPAAPAPKFRLKITRLATVRPIRLRAIPLGTVPMHDTNIVYDEPRVPDDRGTTMKRKKPKDLPPEEGGSCFMVGSVGPVKYYEPMPPGGSRVKYVRGQGIVFVEKIPIPDERAKPTETVEA